MNQCCAQGLLVWALSLLIISFSSSESPAQIFGLGEWSGAYESTTQYIRSESGGGDFYSQNLALQNRLKVGNHGAYILDPELITFSFGGTFGLSQDWFSSSFDESSQRGTLWGYDFVADILRDRAFALNLFANRDQDRVLGGLAGPLKSMFERRGVKFFAREVYLPFTLTFRQEFQDQESGSGPSRARRGQRQNILTYEGERGWLDSEMAVRYEFIDNKDVTFSNLSYKSHEGSLYYSLDFGPELNRRWDSRVRLLNRQGNYTLTSLNLSESLFIRHTDRFWTDYLYSFQRVTGTSGNLTNHIGAFNLTHRLYESLTTRLSLDGSMQKFAGGERDDFRSRLTMAYTKKVPGDGRLNIDLNAGFEYTNSRFPTRQNFVPQEFHTAQPISGFPSLAANIRLANPFVILGPTAAQRPVVRKIVPACGILIEGIDYTLTTFVDFTEIVPNPGAGCSGINPGDQIEVEYNYEVSQSLAYTTVPWRIGISVDYGWIRPFYYHEQTHQTALSGRDTQFLDNHRADGLGTELRYDGNLMTASLSAEVERYTSSRQAYNAFRSSQGFAYRFTPELTFTLRTEESFYSYSRPDRERRLITGRATLAYQFGGELSADAFAAFRDLNDTTEPKERIAEAGVRVRWTFRSVEVLPSFRLIDRRRGAFDNRDYEMVLRLIRRF